MAVYKNITREEYNKLEGVNASKLKGYYESALNGNYEQSKPRTETEAMMKGTAAHSLILEPAEFPKLYGLQPPEPTKEDGSKINKNTKVYKEWKADLPTDKIYFDSDMWQLLDDMDDAVMNDKDCKKILDLCPMRETAVTWTDKHTGLKCKALIDGLGKKLAMDLKTARDIPKRFNSEGELDLEKTAQAIYWKLLIDTKNILQFAFYFDGCIANDLELDRFGAVVVKNDYPVESLALLFNEDTMDVGRVMYNRALDNYIAREDNKSAFNGIMEI
jgi:hypothetical protein